MEISYKDNQFKIKGKTGILYSQQTNVLIESLDGTSKKEIHGAGEYEVSGISVIGLKTDDESLYVYEVDGLRICNLGSVNKKLSDAKVSQIGDIDILLLPNCPESIELMQQIESYYIIPFGFEDEESDKQSLAEGSLSKFLREASFTVERLNKFSVKKDEIIEDSTAQVIVLSA